MSAEIIAKLGLNDEKFDRGLVKSESKFKQFVRRISGGGNGGGDVPLLPPDALVEKRSTGILRLLQKKFGSADLFKDSLRSLGVGLGVLQRSGKGQGTGRAHGRTLSEHASSARRDRRTHP
jgi:hypothetical protein